MIIFPALYSLSRVYHDVHKVKLLHQTTYCLTTNVGKWNKTLCRVNC